MILLFNILLKTLFCLFLCSVIALEIDNGIADNPYIECGGDSMTIQFYMRHPFEGNVYVKNYFQDPQCKTGRTERTEASITVAFGNPCGVRRKRNANPVGISLEAVIVVMFHPQFLTKIDRAYKIECFYMQAEKLVTNTLDISMITTAAIRKDVPMPTCMYQVLDAPLTGNPVRYAMIGDMVYHTWSCTDGSDQDIYCMTIHSCTVDDGLGEIIQLLDKDGCALDKHILQNLKYQSNMMAYRESHVFKFADKQTLYFNCQVRLELKETGYCMRTSDLCAPLHKRKKSKRALSHATVRQHAKGSIDFDLGAQPVGVLEIEGDFDAFDTTTDKSSHLSQKVFLNRISQSLSTHPGNFCLSPLTLGFIFSLLAASLMSALSFVTVFCWAKYRQKLDKFRTKIKRGYFM